MQSLQSSLSATASEMMTANGGDAHHSYEPNASSAAPASPSTWEVVHQAWRGLGSHSPQLTAAIRAERQSHLARLAQIEEVLRYGCPPMAPEDEAALVQVARFSTPGHPDQAQALQAGSWVMHSQTARAVQTRALLAVQGGRSPASSAPSPQPMAEPSLVTSSPAIDSFETAVQEVTLPVLEEQSGFTVQDGPTGHDTATAYHHVGTEQTA